MSDHNVTQHPENVHIGPGRLCFYDEVNDHLIVPGKVEEIRFNKQDPAIVFQNDVFNGRMVEVQGRATEEKYRLLGKFVEMYDPNTLRFFLKNCGTVEQDTTCTLTTVTEEYTVFNDRSIVLIHSNGLYGTLPLPAVQSLSATATGTGGLIPTGNYTMVVTAVYGDTEGNYQEDTVSITLGENCLVTWNAPTGATPTGYRIYEYTTATETRDDAILVHEVTDPSTTMALITQFIHLGEGGNYPGDPVGSFIIADISDVAYEPGSDYEVDTSCGVVNFPSTGDIENGERIRVTYSYFENPNISMSIGPSDTNPKLVRPVILAFKDDDRSTPAPRGIEIELWKVLAENGWELDISTLSFESGFEFEWPVLMSELQMNHGRVTTFNRHYVSYDMLNWATLTNFNNAEACEEATS